MSLFFLLFSIVVLMLCHWWARKAEPSTDSGVCFEKKFMGSLDDFKKIVDQQVQRHPRWRLLPSDSSHFLISESPASPFSFGRFYHVSCRPQEDHLLVAIVVQPKLVTQATDSKKTISPFQKQLELHNVG